MKRYLSSLLLVICMVIILAPTVTLADGDETRGIFIGRYSYNQVFDCQRSPAYPQEGQSFKVSGFALPYDATIGGRGKQFTQGEIENKIFYIKMSSINDAPFALYMADDVDRSNEKAVSNSGNIFGLGKEGFLYVDKDGGLGYLISNAEAYIYGQGFEYNPDIAGPITLDQALEYNFGNETPQEKLMTSIEVETSPNKTTYLEGEKFDPDDLVIKVNYDDDTSLDVEYEGNESLFTFKPSLDTELLTSDDQIEIKYRSKTVNVGIEVSAINRADVENKAEGQTISYKGESYDVSQLFTPDPNAGTPTYTIEKGGTGKATLSGNTISIRKAGTIFIGMTTAQTDNYNSGREVVAALTVDKGEQEAPSGITKVDISAKGRNDGRIKNVTTAMEYKMNGDEYIEILSTEISGLSKGVYTIRYKETELYNASLDIQITIGEPSVIEPDKDMPDRRPSSEETKKYKITVTQSEGGKITPDTVRVTKNSSKTFTITTNGGYEIEDVLVDGKSVGAVNKYTFSKVIESVKITAKFRKTEENPVEPAEANTQEKWKNPFVDVNEKNWFYEAVRYVNENGLMNGTDKTTFGPDIEVTRAMFVTVLFRAEKQPNAGVSSFIDIERGAYYEKAIAWATESGIVKGISKTQFAPSDTITREQMAAIIQRYAIYKGLDAVVSKTTSYVDKANISDYAKEAIAFCTVHEIMLGKNDNHLDPQGTATRAEVSAVLRRFTQLPISNHIK